MKKILTNKIEEDLNTINNFLSTINDNWTKIKRVNSELSHEIVIPCTTHNSHGDELANILMNELKAKYKYLTPKLLKEVKDDLLNNLFLNKYKFNPNNYTDQKQYNEDDAKESSKDLMQMTLCYDEYDMLEFIKFEKDKFVLDTKALTKHLEDKHTLETKNKKQDEAYALIKNIADSTRQLIKLYESVDNPYYTNRFYLLKVINAYLDDNHMLMGEAIKMTTIL